MDNITSNITFTAPWWPLILPLVFISADIFSGWLQATVNHTLDSTKMRTGLFRKAGELAVLVVAYIINMAIVEFAGVYIVATIYICVMELISVCENLDQAGVPLPKWMIKRLKKVKDVLDDSGDDDAEPKDEIQAAIMRTFDGKESREHE